MLIILGETYDMKIYIQLHGSSLLSYIYIIVALLNVPYGATLTKESIIDFNG